jgi:hypothetical protein
MSCNYNRIINYFRIIILKKTLFLSYSYSFFSLHISIFHSQLFGDDGAPDIEQFNQIPQILWSLYFRAFLYSGN